MGVVFVLCMAIFIGCCVFLSIYTSAKSRVGDSVATFRKNALQLPEYEKIKAQNKVLVLSQKSSTAVYKAGRYATSQIEVSQGLFGFCRLYAARFDDVLYFVPIVDKIDNVGYLEEEYPTDCDENLLIKINVSDIKYFAEKGEMQAYSVVNGGGSSLGGAIVGGVIGGATGAVIGSRKNVTSSVGYNDSREIELVYEENGVGKILFFQAGYRENFYELIPEKNINLLRMANQ